MDLRRLKPLDWLTGLFGAALIGLLWAPWYRVSTEYVHFNRSVGAPGGTFGYGPRVDLNAWQAMAVNDVIFFVAGLLAIWVLVATAVNSTSAVPIAAATFATWTGLLVALLAVIRLIFPPDISPGPTERAAGVWLSTAAAIGVAVCAAASMRDERRAEPGSFKLPITELPAPRVSQEGGET